MSQCEDSLSEMAIRLCALVGINFKNPGISQQWSWKSGVDEGARSWTCLRCGDLVRTRTG